MKSFKKEKKYIDGDYEAFVEMYKRDGLSVEGEMYLADTKQQKKINFFLGVKPFSLKTQFYLIDTDNRVVLGMMSLKYNLNPDPERHLRKASKGLQRVYYTKQRFRNDIEVDFCKKADKSEIQSYRHFCKKRQEDLCDRAYKICRVVRRLSM